MNYIKLCAILILRLIILMIALCFYPFLWIVLKLKIAELKINVKFNKLAIQLMASNS